MSTRPRRGGTVPAARPAPCAPRLAGGAPSPHAPRSAAPPAASWPAWTDLDRWTLAGKGGGRAS